MPRATEDIGFYPPIILDAYGSGGIVEPFHFDPTLLLHLGHVGRHRSQNFMSIR
jgi:hypothetical protein